MPIPTHDAFGNPIPTPDEWFGKRDGRQVGMRIDDSECYCVMSAMINYIGRWQTECPPSTAGEQSHVDACQKVLELLEAWYAEAKRAGVRFV